MSEVAICIPCYNNSESTERLLDSIVSQEYRDYSVIMTDDSDNDLIKKLSLEYVQMDILYHKNDTRLGIAGNTNRALRYVQGMDVKYVKIMYHDDYFSSSSSLGKMVKALESNEQAVFAFANTYEIGEGINYERAVSKDLVDLVKRDRFHLAYGNIIGAPSAVIVKKNACFLDERLTWFVDVEWYIQMLDGNRKLIHIEEPLITIGRSNGQASTECVNRPELILSESIYLYKKYPELRNGRYMDFIVGEAERVENRYHICQIAESKLPVFIYGAGGEGKKCADFLRWRNIPYEAFVVSDGQRSFHSLCGHDVLELSEYLEIQSNSMMILALSEKNIKEVIERIKKENINFIVWK